MHKLLCAAGLALGVKLLLALFTTGTNDSITWDQDVMVLRAQGAAELYRNGVQYPTAAGNPGPRQAFIHPPAMLQGLLLLDGLRTGTGIPPHVWMRIACAFADAGTLALLWVMFPGVAYRPALILVALSPISILVSGFHGNTDPVMMFFIVLSIWLLQEESIGWAGVAFGLALGVKLVPVIFVPAVIVSIVGTRNRLKWGGAAIITWVVVSLPWLIQSPGLILRTISGYGGSTGLWGFYLITGVLRVSGYPMWYQIYAPCAKWLALGACASLPFVVKRCRPSLGLIEQCGLIASLFLFLSPGFGLQYLAWTVPWVIALAPCVIAQYYAVTGVFLLSVYVEAAWGNGSRIYADLLLVDNWKMLIEVGIICWIAMGIMTRVYWRLAIPPRNYARKNEGACYPRARVEDHCPRQGVILGGTASGSTSQTRRPRNHATS